MFLQVFSCGPLCLHCQIWPSVSAVWAHASSAPFTSSLSPDARSGSLRYRGSQQSDWNAGYSLSGVRGDWEVRHHLISCTAPSHENMYASPGSEGFAPCGFQVFCRRVAVPRKETVWVDCGAQHAAELRRHTLVWDRHVSRWLWSQRLRHLKE